MTIGDLVSSLNIQTSHIILVIMCSIFLMLGILLVQLFMVLVSVHINSIEEAAAIQGPFYLGMLVVYYLAIFLNSSDQLNQGIGYILSYVPVFSMLFMPSRLLTVQVYSSELWLSMIIACFTLVAGMLLGEKHYQNNLLKGSGKGPYVKK
jgi:ABC-2 type transport system permease protein